MKKKPNFEEIQGQLNQERKLVSFDNYDLSVRELLTMFENKDIIVPPDYQRKFIWNEDRQSKLIESIFLGIPIPNIFMATNSNSTWDIVDGVQRIGTLVHYCGSEQMLKLIKKEKNLEISHLEKFTSINEMTFSQLQRPVQLSFYTRPVRVTVLDDKSDFGVRFDLFERLNTGGVLLSPQEIRNCVFRGDFNDDIKELARDENFNSVVRLKPVDEHNGTREEFVLRFFAFLDNYKYFEHSVKDFLNDYMENNKNQKISNNKKKIFFKAFRFIKESLPGGINRGSRNLTPVNLFEAVAVGTALALMEKKEISTSTLQWIVNHEELKKYITAATNSRRMVEGRINFVKSTLLEND
ncbi:MAG: DUF262 domain-containing protein [Solidesulfovibrio sp.]|uniref:DUF262 domain-containing protein n=1 Tax=Solidesulfovibrio sp. TaxID=2910990 RepID=UPI003158CEC2